MLLHDSAVLYDSAVFSVSVPLLLDYELFPVLTTVNNVAVKILVHVLMHVAKNSSRTSKLGSPAECVVCLFYLKKKQTFFLGEILFCFKGLLTYSLDVLPLHWCSGFFVVVAGGGYSNVNEQALPWLLLLQSTGSRAHGLQQLQLPGSRAQA